MNKIILFGYIFLVQNLIASPDATDFFYKGNFSLGGSISSYASLQKDSKIFTGYIFPTFGYFICNRFALNVSPGYSLSCQYYHYSFDETIINQSIYINPSVIYYFGEKNIYPFVGIGAAFSMQFRYNSIVIYPNGSHSHTFYEFEPNINVGMLFQIKNVFYLSLAVGYSLYQIDLLEPKNNKSENYSHNINLNIGVTKYFIINNNLSPTSEDGS